MASSSMRPRRRLNFKMIQNFHLVWLDENIDENNDEYRDSKTKLQQVINTINAFTDIDECIDFITDYEKENTFMIVSEKFCQTIGLFVQDLSQVNSVYVFSHKNIQQNKWTKQCSKIKGIYTDIASICAVLVKAVDNCERNSLFFSIIKARDGVSKKDLDTQDCSFMYTQILKDILLAIDFKSIHFDEFLVYCREKFDGNISELKNVDKIKKNYSFNEAIRWYTSDTFLYSTVNRALRLMEVELIVKMGFFVRDLHNHIAKLHSEQYIASSHPNSFNVYRGQGLSHKDFEELKNSQGGLISFNNFLSTSLDEAVSRMYAASNGDNSDLKGIIFVMKIDPSIPATPFANVSNVSYFQQEEEILFSMHSVFRIVEVKQIDENNDRIWQVNLTLTSDNDPQLHALTKTMQEEVWGPTGWHQLAQLMIKLGHVNKAEELYDILLKQTDDESEQALLSHYLGKVKNDQGRYTEAIEYFETSIKIRQKILPPIHPDLAASYSSIGSTYKNIGEYSKALSFFEQALVIQQEVLPVNHPDLATGYNNIGVLYKNMGNHTKALLYYERALEIKTKIFPANHPDLAGSYNNVGEIYRSIGEYSKAVTYCEQALQIAKKILPADHPHLSTAYNTIGALYHNMNQYSKALSYYEQALEINKKALSPNHPHLARSYNNIGALYYSIGTYSKAVSYFEKAIEIFRQTLPADHPYLAGSYNNIGEVYRSIGEYSKAVSYCEQALEIEKKILPANHPNLAISYNIIAELYYKIGDYLKAFSFIQRAMNIGQRSLHPN